MTATACWSIGSGREDAPRSTCISTNGREELGPSTQLRKWFGHDPARWKEFQVRYHAELADPGPSRTLDELAERARQTRVTLVFGAHDAEHNQARVIADELERRLNGASFMTLAASAAPAAVIPSPSWPVFETPLVGRELVAERTMSFRFTKPADWTYRAGQFVDITLLDPPETDAEGNTRGFSISSAPSEDVITITTRLRDTAFKRVLRTMPLGTASRSKGRSGTYACTTPPGPQSSSPAGSASRRSGASFSRRSVPAACRIRSSSSTPTDGRRTRPSSTSSARWPSSDAYLPSFRRCRDWSFGYLGGRTRPHRCVDARPSPRRRDRRHLLPDRPTRHGPGAPDDARRSGRRRGRHPDRGIHRLLIGGAIVDAAQQLLSRPLPRVGAEVG